MDKFGNNSCVLNVPGAKAKLQINNISNNSQATSQAVTSIRQKVFVNKKKQKH